MGSRSPGLVQRWERSVVATLFSVPGTVESQKQMEPQPPPPRQRGELVEDVLMPPGLEFVEDEEASSAKEEPPEEGPVRTPASSRSSPNIGAPRGHRPHAEPPQRGLREVVRLL